jgi:hypothetical protein
MHTVTILPDPRQPATALSTAVSIAGLAPSIHNTQPWRWRIRPAALELWAEGARQLPVSDPDGHLLTLSCGAALHHARVALAAQGYHSLVFPFPDPAHPDLLARLCLAGPVPVTAATMRLYHAIGLRGTDRRPGHAQAVDDNALLSVVLAVQSEGCFLYPLRPDQVAKLATIVTQAQDTQASDDGWRAEIAQWTGAHRPDGLGVPDANLPDRRPPTRVALRDFGHHGTLPLGDGDDRAATYAILYGEVDEPVDWLDAGQAVSHTWLTATDAGLSVMPVSAVVEVPVARQRLRRLLPSIGYPYLVLRLAEAAADRAPAPTPRLAPERTVATAN